MNTDLGAVVREGGLGGVRAIEVRSNSYGANMHERPLGKTRKEKHTSNMAHLPVVTRHQLDIHLLPGTGSVGSPGERALIALLEYIARTRGSRDDFRVHKHGVGNESNESGVCEHRDDFRGGC